jgi:hypothetical protein
VNSNHAVQSSATPIIGAVALLNAWNEATQAVLWRKVRKCFEELRTAEVEAARNVKSAAEALEHFDEQQEVVCSGWKAVFNQFYARGRQNGTRKETLASVVRKSASAVRHLTRKVRAIYVRCDPSHIHGPQGNLSIT